MNELSIMLYHLRTKAKMSLKEVYKATGISDSKLSRIEHGANVSEPAPSILRTLAKQYNVSLIDLYLVAGYLNAEDLASYERVFRCVDLLTDDEKQSIQTQIDLFTKGRN